MQKFEPRTRIGISGNERTRSTPLDPKLMFWCVFVVFGCICQCFLTTWNSMQKRVELVQLMDKFVPLSRIGIFRYERTRSTPLDPKLKYWFVSYCLGALLICFASEFLATNAPDPPHWTLNSWIGAFRTVWVYFGLFRYYTKLDAKWAELVQLMQKFVPRTRIGIFGNESMWSTH